jgi:hypothetical protein
MIVWSLIADNHPIRYQYSIYDILPKAMFPCAYLLFKFPLFRNFTNEDQTDLTWLAISHLTEL